MSCPDCISGEFLPGEPTGEILPEYHNAYLAAAPKHSTTSSKRAVLLFTDAFGLPLKNSKILADKLAQRLECDVWAPDYFNGEPFLPVQYMLPDRAGAKMTTQHWLQLFTKVLPRIGVFYRNRPSVLDDRVKKFVALLREKKDYEKIGAVGFCAGGATCIRFGPTGLLDSIVIYHPGPFSLDDVKAFKVPSAWVCAEEDQWFADKKREEAQAILESKKGTEEFVEHEFVIYPGTAHGFGSRPNLNLPDIKKAHEDAFEQTVKWFEKTLPVV